MRPNFVFAKARDYRSGKIKAPFATARITGEAEGAIPNKTRVCKTNTEPGDATRDGEMGTVIASLALPNNPEIAYFVKWDHSPDVQVAVMGSRIKPAGGKNEEP